MMSCAAIDHGIANMNMKNNLARDLLRRRNRGMHSARSIAVGRSFKTQPRDVFVVTYPKCGTTWVTQIVHQLRTGGDMSFGEITQVAPWDILAHDCGQSLDAAHPNCDFRLFKSHEAAHRIAAPAKYIYVARDPRDALVSFYYFLPSYFMLPKNELSMEDFCEFIFAGRSHSGYIWEHLLGWWRRRHDADVLWLFFEDLKDDLPRQVRRVAAFVFDATAREGGSADFAGAKNRPPADLRRRIDIAIERSSFEFMRAHAVQFDEHFTFAKRRAAMGLPRAAVYDGIGKVRAGGGGDGKMKVGARDLIPPSIMRRLEAKWREVLARPTGCANYAEWRRGWHAADD